MIQRKRNVEVTAAIEPSKEEKQLYIIKTVFFEVTYQQMIANINKMIYDYVYGTGSELKYVEAFNFNTGEKIDLGSDYPAQLTKGVLKPVWTNL